MRIEFSLRYCVIGFYRDRSGRPWILYPIPFMRLVFRDKWDKKIPSWER